MTNFHQHALNPAPAQLTNTDHIIPGSEIETRSSNKRDLHPL